jgi:hypothetical protein
MYEKKGRNTMTRITYRNLEPIAVRAGADPPSPPPAVLQPKK